MLEYHGWIVIRQSPYEDDDRALDAAFQEISEEVARRCYDHRLLGAVCLNGQYFVWAHGFTNHRGGDIEDVEFLFRYVAEKAPGSYGLLYTWDDERPGGLDNEFRVLRLARGKVEELADPFLSPCIPTVEDPYPNEEDARWWLEGGAGIHDSEGMGPGSGE